MAFLYELDGKLSVAVPLYATACEAGHFDACTNLGRLYESGWDETRGNLGRALALYKLACDGKYQPGCERLDKLRAKSAAFK